MSEEKMPLSPATDAAEEKPQTAEPKQQLTPGQQHRRQKSVFQYITVLFGAAFFLLLFTFMMERRQNDLLQQQSQSQIDSLQQTSVSAVQSLNNLVDQNEELKKQVEELEQQIAELEGQVGDLEGQTTGLTDQLAKTNAAMDWFWQVNEAYARGKYSLCRSLTANLENAPEGETPLKEYLPKESTTGNGRFSPADRYQEIYDKVF